LSFSDYTFSKAKKLKLLEKYNEIALTKKTTGVIKRSRPKPKQSAK